MDNNIGKLTILFENPFWIGIFEQISDGKLSVCKVTFGPEPKDYEVHDFILQNYSRLRFSPAVEVERRKVVSNPKRMQREVRKQMQERGISTKSQQALSLQHEEMKTERKRISKEQKEAEKEQMFTLKQQKRKEKHRGR